MLVKYLLAMLLPITAFAIDFPNYFSPIGSTVSSGGGGSGTTVPGGSNQNVQYNNAGAFGGISGTAYNGSSFVVTIPMAVNTLLANQTVSVTNYLGVGPAGASFLDPNSIALFSSLGLAKPVTVNEVAANGWQANFYQQDQFGLHISGLRSDFSVGYGGIYNVTSSTYPLIWSWNNGKANNVGIGFPDDTQLTERFTVNGNISATIYKGQGVSVTNIDVVNNINTPNINGSPYPPAGGSMTISATQSIPSLSIMVGSRAGGSTTTAISQTASTILGMDAMVNNNQGISNTIMGARAFFTGGLNTNTIQNVVIGERAAQNTSGGNPSGNVVIGSGIMQGANGGFSNGVFIGAGLGGTSGFTGASNVIIGQGAATALVSGAMNTAIGHSSLLATSGSQNSVLGDSAGNFGTGTLNVAMGYQALTGSGTKSFNTSIGANAGQAITTGFGNTLLGFSAGNTITTGTGNIVIGANQPAFSATVSGSLNIGGAIYGDISQGGTGMVNRIGINIISPSTNLDVSGTVSATFVQATSLTILPALPNVAGTSYLCYDTTTGRTTRNNTACTASDRSLKINIAPISYEAKDLMKLNPVQWDWADHHESDHRIGFIAQDVAAIIPEVTDKGDDGIWTLNPGMLVPLLVKVAQQQQVSITDLETRLKQLEDKIP